MPLINKPSSWVNNQLQILTLENRKLRAEIRDLKAELSIKETMAEEGERSSRFHGLTSIVQESRA